jgi:DNA (cytosine-5)-methyltransferase 1
MVEQATFPSPKYTGVELFAGGGGLAIGVHKAGFRPLLVNEYARRACETLRANHAQEYEDKEYVPEEGDPWPLIEGDVRDVKFGYLEGKVDLLAGGPPCQPFSLGGVHRGDEDARNMFPQFFRAMREIRPRAFICENVRGLLRPSFERYFEYIKNELRLPFVEREGESWEEHNDLLAKRLKEIPEDSPERYYVKEIAVNAADYGVPQIRRRVIIVGFRADLGIDWHRFEPKPTHSEAALIGSIKSGEYWRGKDGRRRVPKAVRKAVEDRYPDALPLADGLRDLQPWRTLRDAIEGIDGAPTLPAVHPELMDRATEIDGIRDHVGWPGARIYNGHTPNELDRPAKTVKAGVHGVPGGESVVRLDDGSHRYMTVRETARVMTFPDDWRLAGPRGEKMRQLGNAVPVTLAERFARAISEALDSLE